MIISRTPFRCSFIGGGTDLPSFYKRRQGAIISTSINKYVYITVNGHFDHTFRISYSKTEITDRVDKIQHSLFRETIKEVGIKSGLELTSIADIPSGTGLGSSSSFTVGLLNALHGYKGEIRTAEQLAQGACKIEIDILKEPIGKQDQFAAAYGGLRRYLFNSDGSVFVDPVICTPERRQDFFDHLMLFYLGGSRSASEVLQEVTGETAHLDRLRALVDDFWGILTSRQDLRGLGEILHEGWENKKRMSQNVTSPVIDRCYQTAREAGALGGKILGAGGTGFLMLFCEPKHQYDVRHDLWYGPDNPREVSFRYEPEGSKIAYAG
jgi:D-glycero-alpha-D-manno-heptose-7-phosphate kinase